MTTACTFRRTSPRDGCIQFGIAAGPPTDSRHHVSECLSASAWPVVGRRLKPPEVDRFPQFPVNSCMSHCCMNALRLTLILPSISLKTAALACAFLLLRSNMNMPLDIPCGCSFKFQNVPSCRRGRGCCLPAAQDPSLLPEWRRAYLLRPYFIMSAMTLTSTFDYDVDNHEDVHGRHRENKRSQICRAWMPGAFLCDSFQTMKYDTNDEGLLPASTSTIRRALQRTTATAPTHRNILIHVAEAFAEEDTRHPISESFKGLTFSGICMAC